MGFYKDSASSEMSRLHDLSAQQGRRIADLEAEIERLLDIIEVHVDPTGFEDDADMQWAMTAIQGRW